ncbi:hypothetical protein Trydic_g8438 [Trypoxylus dichotomus]
MVGVVLHLHLGDDPDDLAVVGCRDSLDADADVGVDHLRRPHTLLADSPVDVFPMVEQSSESASEVDSLASGRASCNMRMASTASPRLRVRRSSLADYFEVPIFSIVAVAVAIVVFPMSGVTVFGAVLETIRPGGVVLSFSASVCNKYKREGERGTQKGRKN